MNSNKQIEANRANALKSTGPKTQVGKNKSRKNAIKHGLTARTIVLAGEDADELDRFVEQLMGELDARNMLERQLVQNLAQSFWRVRRAPVFEANAICALRAQMPARELESEDEAYRAHMKEIAARYAQYIRPTCDQPSQETTVVSTEAPKDLGELFRKQIGLMFIKNSNLSNLLMSLDRHEATLLNTTVRTLHLLFSLMKMRKGSMRGSPANTKSIAARWGSMIVPGEDSAELQKLCTALQEDHGSETLVQRELVGYIAGLLWRLARVPVFERSIIKALQGEFKPAESIEDHEYHMAEIADVTVVH